ncbi:hypothetical protein [Methylocystis iwaonis]|uniref:hypothetical protein n=1 Tax=Methylocystis iwaonis TaxID=2885079 RepID=UPI002E7C0DDE|nr:hypothetical protein [Methylocystis iwaonis]
MQRATDDRQINVVDEYAPLRKSYVIALVELPAEDVVETRRDCRFDLPPNDMRIKRKAAVAERAHEVVTAEHSDVDVGPVRCLEREVQLDEVHQEAGLGFDDKVVEVAQIGQMRRDGAFAPRHRAKAHLVLQRPQH